MSDDLYEGIHRRIYVGCLRGERINSVSELAELTFWHLNCLADDYGNIEGSDPFLALDAFPRRRITAKQMTSRIDELVAAKLVELSGMSNVFFCSTGLEANEAALKMARKFGHSKGIARPEVVVYEKAFHGRSIATLSATGNAKIQVGFEPLLEGFVRVPINDIAALK
jgi:hypothetical protein